jgi:hypothetical protein
VDPAGVAVVVQAISKYLTGSSSPVGRMPAAVMTCWDALLSWSASPFTLVTPRARANSSSSRRASEAYPLTRAEGMGP